MLKAKIKSKNKTNYDRLDNDYISEAYRDLALAEEGRSFKDCCGILNGDTGFFKAGRLNIDFADGANRFHLLAKLHPIFVLQYF